MAQRHIIETYGLAHTIETYGHTIPRRRRRRHAWPILLSVLHAAVYPLLASIPLRQWCIFPPMFKISPLFPKKISDCVKNFPNVFWSSTKNFQFPYFRYYNTFTPISRKLLFPLLFKLSSLYS